HLLQPRPVPLRLPRLLTTPERVSLTLNPTRRKHSTPSKRYELPNYYSGSTSTASPGSPPHSHSTEGGEPGEESDR
ncbi:Hypothetical protein FKW44_015831, partial [Caligus rogercresseyi]